MKFWDSSAIVPLLLDEPGSEAMLAVLDEDPIMVVWWSTPVECTSAVSRRERDNALTADEARQSLDRLHYLASGWQEMLPSMALRRVAERLLRVHPLRAADSLQLAAAIVAAEREPATLDLVCLDERLTDAAAREGFRLITG